MRGLFLQDAKLSYREDLPEPVPGPDDTLVDVLMAGICATDLALQRGYMGFTGIPGHEFVGVARTGPLAGQRVVGDINAACGDCAACAAEQGHHCPNRTVLGILNHGGAFAERLCLPTKNLLPVPDRVSSEAATFVEPLAAAFEIGEQVSLHPGQRALVAGDGRLGLLCAWALHLAGVDVTVAGRHPERQELLPAATPFLPGGLGADPLPPRSTYDLVVEATGRPQTLGAAIAAVRPRGTLILKTTTEVPVTVDLSPLVVDEIQLIGSRCGPFPKALAALAEDRVPVQRWIHARFPLPAGEEAFATAGSAGVLKVLVETGV